MKIRIIPKGDGTMDVYFERTRAKEGRGVFLKAVVLGDLRATVAPQVRRMRGELEPESPEGL